MLRFRILLFLLVITNIDFVSSTLKVISCESCGGSCDDEVPTNLTVGEYVRLETINYPESRTACDSKFVRTDGKDNIWFVFLNGVIDYFSLTGYSLNNTEFETVEYYWKTVPSWFSEMSSYPRFEFYCLHTVNLNFIVWRGFQAFVYAPSLNELSLCPLSTIKTFTLDNNLDVIPITSNFNNLLKLSPQKCTWTFQIPNEFKLKIHVKVFVLHYPSTLSITIDSNKTIVPITDVGIKYLNGSIFTVIFDTQKNIVGSLDFFAAFISAVPVNPFLEENNCDQLLVINNDTRTTIFGNYNESVGYGNNEICQLPISTNLSQTTLSISWDSYLEAGVDSLILEDKSSGKTYDITQNANWTIMNPSNLSNFQINFESDGNIIYPGFKLNVTAKTSLCKCSNASQIFSCTNLIYTFPALLNDEYCNIINCSYTITSDKKCGNYSSLLIPKILLPQNSSNTVTIYEEDNLIEILNSTNSETLKHYLFNQESDIRINIESNFTTVETAVIMTPSISFGIANLNASQVLINLTPENFTYSMDMNFMGRTLLTIRAPENFTLDLYIYKVYQEPTTDSILKNTFLYDSNTIENFVGDLHNISQNKRYQLLSSYSSTSNSLTLFKSSFSTKVVIATLFFRLREIHAKNCISTENVFYALSSTFQMTALEKDPCIVTILQVNISSTTNVELSYLKTNASENVKYVAGVDPKYPFFEFNSKTVSLWTKLYFYGPANSFIIPSGSYLKFKAATRIDFLSDGYKDNNIKKGVLSSPTYGSPWKTAKSTNKVYIKNDTFCIMTVKFLDLSSNAYLNVSVKRFLKSDDIPAPIITYVNQTFNFTTLNYPDNIEVSLILNEPIVGHRGYLIEFEMIPSKAAQWLFHFSNSFYFFTFFVYNLLNFYHSFNL